MSDPKMTFSGAALLRVRNALDLAISELHNQIATCPDVIRYEDDIDACEMEIAYLQKLIARIDTK